MRQDFEKEINLRGFHIPPYRVAYISTQANKIANILADASRFTLSLDEVNLTLDLVRHIFSMEVQADDT